MEKSTLKRLKFLPGLFRMEDVEKLVPHPAMFLSRALKNGLIHRLMRGHYVNSFLYGFPRVETVGCFLRPPAYVSGEWALNYHGISLQSPVVCTIITLSPAVGKCRNIPYQGITIEFSRISPTLFSGFIRIDDFDIATPEKALLDTLHLRKSLPAEDELELDSIDIEAMNQMAQKFPLSVTRRLDHQRSSLLHISR
jgi:predicted transcriptional regulator of viral defense system